MHASVTVAAQSKVSVEKRKRRECLVMIGFCFFFPHEFKVQEDKIRDLGEVMK